MEARSFPYLWVREVRNLTRFIAAPYFAAILIAVDLLAWGGAVVFREKAPSLDAACASSLAATSSPRAGRAPLTQAAASGGLAGIASWYGAHWQGRKTASGTRFNYRKLTAAHRSLPLNTRVRVTNRENGQSVIVLINDRGPYVDDRVIDLSMGAARRLGMVREGLVPVCLQVVDVWDQPVQISSAAPAPDDAVPNDRILALLNALSLV